MLLSAQLTLLQLLIFVYRHKELPEKQSMGLMCRNGLFYLNHLIWPEAALSFFHARPNKHPLRCHETSWCCCGQCVSACLHIHEPFISLAAHDQLESLGQGLSGSILSLNGFLSLPHNHMFTREHIYCAAKCRQGSKWGRTTASSHWTDFIFLLRKRRSFRKLKHVKPRGRLCI